MEESIKERPKKRGRYGRYLMDSDPLATIPRSTKERLGISDQPHKDPGTCSIILMTGNNRWVWLAIYYNIFMHVTVSRVWPSYSRVAKLLSCSLCVCVCVFGSEINDKVSNVSDHKPAHDQTVTNWSENAAWSSCRCSRTITSVLVWYQGSPIPLALYPSFVPVAW